MDQESWQTDCLYIKYDQILLDKKFELKHAKPGDVGYDLPVVMSDKLKIEPHQDYYVNNHERWFDIPPFGLAEIPCGLSIKIPDGYWGNIKPRSSTGWKRRLVVYEGVIDSQYTGSLFILAENPGNKPARIREFDKLAQLILIPKAGEHQVHSMVVPELPKTVRGDTGFGSSDR
jgi:deoxyuridine 5'-triphosphate nucleotidohydrolase